MEFRITPKDVGRTAIAKNGMNYVIKKRMCSGYPYMTDKGACTSEGRVYYSDGTCGDDLIAWADEQQANQVRPKDLRDEFAMVAMMAVITTLPHSIKKEGMFDEDETLDNVVARNAYEYADAMMKAREAK